VLTVVAKLFNIVQPDFAVFGRKDLQQAALVRALVRDLDMPITIVLSPIVREADGLALSSRNRYFDAADRARATLLSRALETVREEFRDGTRETQALEAAGLAVLSSDAGVTPDYLAVIDPATFQRPGEPTESHAAIVAARIGATRLIDNMTIGRDDQD
jgi:pantoate--beta-alanine ligase